MSDKQIDFRDLAKVKQVVAESGGAISEPQVRWWIFNRASNGLEQSGAVVRVGRTIYIHRARLGQWMAGGA